MKKWLLAFTVLATMTACSVSNEKKQSANDSYEKNGSIPAFAKLETAGVSILGQDNSYQLPSPPKTNISVDIRPPSTPIALIGHSVAQFNGKGSSIVYPAEKRSVYNLEQIKRLLSEQNIAYTSSDNQIQTDWTPTGRLDDIGDTQIRYLIQELGNQEANALMVEVLEMKRDGIIFTPSIKDKERYTSDRLNQLVSELQNSYRTQQQQTTTVNIEGTVQSAIITDSNQHLALAMNINFAQAWHKLGEILPQLGFEIKDETAGRGYRLLKYKPTDPSEWNRLGLSQPELERGEYHMQLNSYGKESAVVISNEDKVALDIHAQAVYQALQIILAK